MEPGRFDALTKTFAQPTSRRGALRRLLGGGLTAALLGTSAQRALAQATPAVTTSAGTQLCLFPFEATVRRGPDAGLSLDGLLALGLTPAGAVDHGQLVQADGTTVPVVGQVTGRAVNLLFQVGTGQTVYGVGTAAQDLRTACAALMTKHLYAPMPPLGGPLVGPKGDDSGDWATCCCPAASNNYDCGSLPPCKACAPAPSGNYTDQNCVSGCRNTGESLSYCSQFCTLQS